MLILNLQYDEKNNEYCQTINWSGKDLAFSVYGAGRGDENLVAAKVQKTWEWVQNNLNSLKLFASSRILNRHAELNCFGESPEKLANVLPPPSAINIAFTQGFEVILEDVVLDEILGGSCYEISVKISDTMQMKDAFLFKYS